MHIACLWAKGSRTIEEAGKKIADELFNCGKFVYHPDSHYNKETSLAIEKKIDSSHLEEESLVMNYFYLTKVIERINGGNGLGDQVNCVDCSLIVSSLVNILGGNLHVGKLQRTEDTNYADPDIVTKNRFEIKKIKTIGSESPEKTMESLESEGKSYFSFHSIAWQPASTESPQFDDPKNIIYDACVQFINDEVDESALAETASGMLLGEDDDNSGYRAQLSASNELGIGSCLAQP
ncbi:MAG: hypothetical protein P8P74_18555 [Crocinitomicaceae bacterium]|nr:hypothetical protein [Crocinitomicaceae bacterium]